VVFNRFSINVIYHAIQMPAELRVTFIGQIWGDTINDWFV